MKKSKIKYKKNSDKTKFYWSKKRTSTKLKSFIRTLTLNTMKKEDDQIYKKTPIKQSYIGVKKNKTKTKIRVELQYMSYFY